MISLKIETLLGGKVVERNRVECIIKNCSPKPLFETDEGRTYLETTIFIREGFNESREMSDKDK